MTVRTAAQQKRSANKKRYKILNPFDATNKAIIDRKITKVFGDFKFLFIFFPSTTIKLEMAFNNVSILSLIHI